MQFFLFSDKEYLSCLRVSTSGELMTKQKGNFKCSIAGDLATTIKKKNALVELIQAKAAQASNRKLIRQKPVYEPDQDKMTEAEEDDMTEDEEDENLYDEAHSKTSSKASSPSTSPEREVPEKTADLTPSSPASLNLTLQITALEQKLSTLKEAVARKAQKEVSSYLKILKFIIVFIIMV